MTSTQALTKSLFPRSSFLGFDPLFREFDTLTKVSDAYPPHNVVSVDEDNIVIEVAVAGFSKEDLSIEQKERLLTISGSKENQEEKKYLHKGISTKRFSKSFRLSEDVKVVDADLVDGMLTINLEYVVPESKKPKLIAIGNQ